MRVLTRALSFRANYRCYYERSDLYEKNLH
nr:MAG TPA: hypothetical protein [Caudoviricetes sp.]